MSIEDTPELEPIDGAPETRRVTPGGVVSAVGHTALLGWLVLGWGLTQEPLPFEVTEVSVVSGEEYAALVAATSPQPLDTQPETPVAPDVLPAPEAPPEPTSPPEPEQPVTPPQQEPPPVPPVEELPVPAAPDPLPPQTEVADLPPEIVPPAPPAPPPQAAVLIPDTRPQPRPAPRVAPEAALPPPPEAEIAPVVQQEVAPDVVSEPVVEEAQEATAPEEATTEIVTEADTPSGAVETAIRPPARPQRPTPPPQTPGETSTADSQNAAQSAVDAAVAAAAGDPGPPMTGAERDAFRLSVQGCWVVDPGSTAARVTVTVAFELGRDGRVVAGNVIMIGNTGGEPAAVQTAFESARRAVLRCQADGFPLPADKYEQWRLVEMTFNPAEMRIR